MTPVIIHLRNKFSNLPLPTEQYSSHWTFNKEIELLGAEFYSQIVSLHPLLNCEYSILCHQLKHNLTYPQQISNDHIIDQLSSALMLAELLEHTHLHYLVVPREVVRLRRHQHVYRELLNEMAGYTFPLTNSKEVHVGASLSHYIRESTAQINWFRLLITRSKRLLNFIELVGTNSEIYSSFIRILDKYTNPFFAYLSWCFFIPRLSTNLFLIAKHTIPWSEMGEKEKSLEWYIRLEAQIQRRWFELANDIVWVAAGLTNCFVLIGALAPFAIYLTLFAFAFDVVNAGIRLYIELSRLYKLKKEYTEMLHSADNEESKKAIEDYMHYLNHRINFETLRLGLSLAGVSAIFLAMCLAFPVLALNPVLPLVGAVLLILVWVATYTLTQVIEHYRPNENIEKPSGVSRLGFFATKKEAKLSPVTEDVEFPENLRPSLSGG